MTKKHIASNQQAKEGWSTYNVIAVSFDDDRNAETAMTLLKELDAQERIIIEQAVVVGVATTGKSSKRTGPNRRSCSARPVEVSSDC